MTISNDQQNNQQVVFIMGVGHSGSTLLELVLSSHSQVLGLGEVASLREKLDRSDPDAPRLCSICDADCELWNGRADYAVLRRYFSNRSLLSILTRQFHRIRKSIYHYFFEWFEPNILVDSSKRVSWIQRQLQPAYLWRQIEPVLLYITRDGRAVVNSYLRKYPGAAIAKVTQNWKDNVERMEQFFQQFEGKKQIVSYETLATSPVETTRSLSRFLGIRYEPEMLHYWKHDHHLCDGNLGTRSLIYRYRSQLGKDLNGWSKNLQELKTSHGEYYDRVGLAIRLDLRWKRELTEEQRKVFEAIAGETNQAYAYEPDADMRERAADPWSLTSPG